MNDAVSNVQACVERVREREAQVQAWQFFGEDLALAQARRLDAAAAAGVGAGALQALPVGIKDIIDTADMPTENGTVLHAGRRPQKDAWVVDALRSAGAVPMGKTVTTELATYSPGKTRNPHDPGRTPGGSSSGSAAAVAAGMVPLAIGSQTNGSVIRPAAFCGVWGFKPTHGRVPTEGVLRLSPTLDTLGWFARSLDDVALAAKVLARCDPGGSDPQADRRIAFVRTPVWDKAESPMQAALLEAARRLGDRCQEVELPEALHPAWDWHRTIMESEMAFHLAAEWKDGRDRLSAPLRAQLERGRSVPAADYQFALSRVAFVQARLEAVFDRFDAILTPSAAGAAPPLETTGDPAFCTLWSLAGTPALNMPLASDAQGMPLGLQLVGRRGDDAGLLRTARWLAATLAQPGA